MVRQGIHVEVRAQCQAALSTAFDANPARFRYRAPVAPRIAPVVWINQAKSEEVATFSSNESV
jgi:hypothetical protein